MTLTMSAWNARADEARILADLERFFASDDAAERHGLVEKIRSDPAYDRSRVGDWLHKLDLYDDLEPGSTKIDVAVGYGQARRLTLRLPRGYTPQRAWPLLYTLHPSGGSGPGVLAHVEQALGESLEGFILAAPNRYRQTGLDAPPPYTPEHPVMLRQLRRTVHVDSDRVYALGYSLGGYASWALALLHADQIAGAVPISSAFTLPADVEGLWEAFVPNFAHVPILHAWGERDSLNVPGFEGRYSTGSMSDLNRQLSPLIKKLELDVVDHPVAGRGHGGVEPRRAALESLLAHRRLHYPVQVGHLFRHLHQASTYWLEGHTWEGEHWSDHGRDVPRRRGESWPAATARYVMPLLGELRGVIDGQELSIKSRNLSELTVWFGDGMVDWNRSVTVELDGKEVFKGRLEPDLSVCLREAARTYDFDRLRWAGLRIAGSEVQRVNADTSFPPLIREP